MKTEVKEMKEVKKDPVPGVKNEFIGQIISQDLGNYLRRYLTGTDKAIISAQTRVGYHTVDKLILGSNPLTEKNCIALPAAIEAAIEKASQEEKEAKEAMRCLKSTLKN